MAQNRETILKKLLSNIWLFENMLWKFGDKILYDSTKEKYKRFLYELYWKKDVFSLFPEEIDKEEYNKTLKTLFTYYEDYEWSNAEGKRKL